MDESDSALLKCDRNQNTCDDKSEPNLVIAEPSWLLDQLAALLPSNFLNLPPRWRDWFIRGQSGILLISCFCTLISLGPLGLFSLTIIVQVSIGYQTSQSPEAVRSIRCRFPLITSCCSWASRSPRCRTSGPGAGVSSPWVGNICDVAIFLVSRVKVGW